LNSEQFVCNIPVIVINLKRRADRKHAMETQLKQIGFSDVTFFEAVDGSQLILNEPLVRLFQGNDFGSRKGVIGCALSHFYLWQKIAKGDYRESDVYLVLEDDVTFNHYVAKILQEQRAALAKEEMVLLGYHTWSN
jgi:GR25 family glycosyltransferase involved in LPS biosynthesis